MIKEKRSIEEVKTTFQILKRGQYWIAEEPARRLTDCDRTRLMIEIAGKATNNERRYTKEEEEEEVLAKCVMPAGWKETPVDGRNLPAAAPTVQP